jgi:hypothetical protein
MQLSGVKYAGSGVLETRVKLKADSLQYGCEVENPLDKIPRMTNESKLGYVLFYIRAGDFILQIVLLPRECLF